MFLSTRLRMTTPRRSWIGLVLVLALVVSLAAHFAANPGSETRSVMAARPVMADLNNMQLSFIPNMGQADPAVQYHVRSMGGTLYFTNENVVFVLPSEPLDSNESVTSYVVRLNFEGANPAPTFSSLDRLPGLANYFRGDDPAQWRSNVPTYGGIQYNQIYPGIDLRYEGSEGVLKGSYVVAPGIDPAQIRWSYAQSDSVALDATSGDLRIQLPQLEGEDPAEIVERAPVAWQTIDGEQIPVDVRYALDEGSVSFVVGDYDPAYELVLDPILQYSSYYGGDLVDQAYSMAADAEGNVYLTGLTMGGTFLTVHPYQATVPQLEADAFVVKISASSGIPIFATFLGGTDYEAGRGIAIDANNNVYVAGETLSANFPKQNAYDSVLGNDFEGFVTAFNSDGNALLYSTYLGGTLFDRINDIAVISGGTLDGTAVVVGETNSTNFPVMAMPVPHTAFNGGDYDGFLTRLSPVGQAVYSGYYGGGGTDKAFGVAVDTAGYAYIVGQTNSSNNIASSGAAQTTPGGEVDAFIAQIKPTGTRNTYFGTYLGGNGDDEAFSVAVTGSGTTAQVFVAGSTDSANFPAPNSLYTFGGGGLDDAFVAQYKVTDSYGHHTRVFSTFIGGSGADVAYGIAYSPSDESLIIGGKTLSSNFPTLNPLTLPSGYNGANYSGLGDAFVTQIHRVVPGSTTDYTYSTVYSSYLGGAALDIAHDVATDAYGTTYMVGETESTNWPTSGNIQQMGGRTDSFIVRAGSSSADLSLTIPFDTPDPATVGSNVTYTIQVGNSASSDMARNVVVRDPLPVETTYVSSDTTAGSCSHSNGIVRCNLGDMAGNTNHTIHITVRMETGGNVGNTAYVISSMFDPNSNNNKGQQSTAVQAYADLQVTITGSNPNPQRTEQLIFTISVRNNGPYTATQTTMNLALAPELHLDPNAQGANPWVPDGTSFDANQNKWTINTVTVNQTVTMMVYALVNESVPVGTNMVTSANSLDSAQIDQDETNNSFSYSMILAADQAPPGCYPSEVDPSIIFCQSN